MKLDSKRQQELLLSLLDAAQFPGRAIDDVFALRQALMAAEVDGEERKPQIVKTNGKAAHVV